ncbi:hypothetical protein GCM10023185_30240 [Hymenobacter saemangeumensis]|uniref:T9SS type A sorting domain-containing protein n=1 Tax=Hymenobacter saemangeumensis TaxID=1084522 RepID=A0ABP8IME0_9BACT
MKTTTLLSSVSRLGFLLACGLAASGAHGQAGPTWTSVWRSSSATASGYAAGRSIALAADGSRYVSGQFEGPLTLGSVTLTPGSGSSHYFLACFDAQGAVRWARQVDGSGSSIGSVAVDAAGNAYLAGDFYGSVDVDGATLSSAAGDSYLVKFNAQGQQQWLRQAGTGTYAGSLAVDASGNVCLAGFSGNAAVYGSPLPGGPGIFFGKISPSGTVLLATRVSTGSSSYSIGGNMTLDAAGNAYLIGSFNGRPSFGATTLVPAGDSDIFLCKLDAAGTPLWARRLGGSNTDNPGGVAVDAAGNVVVCGSSAYGLPGSGDPPGATLYLSRFSPQGTALWERQVGPIFSSSNTNLINSYVAGVAYDGRGGILVTGRLNGTASFGPSTTLNSYTAAAFVVRYDGQGQAVWADHSVATGSHGAAGGTPAVASDGRIFLVGTAMGSVTFGSVATTPPATGRADVFVAELAPGSVLATTSAAPRLALSAYPNPATEAVTLTLPTAAHLRILDALGREVRGQQLPAGPSTVPLTGLAPGLYQLAAQLTNGQTARAQVVVR